MRAEVSFLKKLWALFLALWPVVGTLVTGLTSVQFFPAGYEIFALIGLTVVATVCVSRLFSQSLLQAFCWSTVMPAITSGVSSGLRILFVPLPPDTHQKFGNDLTAAWLVGALMALFALIVGGILAGCCVGMLNALHKLKRYHVDQ
ncbi:MAG: hypothetical protein ACKVHE_21650 [Planctomycetales bacterium]|jgi:hypothetical protein